MKISGNRNLSPCPLSNYPIKKVKSVCLAGGVYLQYPASMTITIKHCKKCGKSYTFGTSEDNLFFHIKEICKECYEKKNLNKERKEKLLQLNEKVKET